MASNSFKFCSTIQKEPILKTQLFYILLAYLLADNGYDIFLANVRGTEFSRNHRTLNSSNTQYWNFSFHEMAIYDLPAIIDYILETANQSALHYVGHSQGTTVVMAMLSLLPQYNEKLITLHLMCPIVFLKHSGIFFRTISSFSDQIEVKCRVKKQKWTLLITYYHLGSCRIYGNG